MEELFRIELKENDERDIRPESAVGGIIYKDGKVLLTYSKEFDYYMIPGGEKNTGESDCEALVRLVAEKTGFRVDQDTVKEFGNTMVIRKTSNNEAPVVEQDNRYYFCDLTGEDLIGKTECCEDEEEFCIVWVNAFEASKHNEYNHKAQDKLMLAREARVLAMADSAIAKRERRLREQKGISELGNPDYADMLEYVENQLRGNTEDFASKQELNYSRFEHTKRVLMWTKKLYDAATDKENIDYDAVITAAIFHDVGKRLAAVKKIDHATAGVGFTRDYLSEHGFSEDRTEYICYLVAHHSDKYLMKNIGENYEGIDRNLLLLMEADLLDDSGALGILMDAMITVLRNPDATYADCYEHIIRYTQHIQKDNPMVTEEARTIWNDKTKLVDDFVNSLVRDLEFR